MPNNDLKRLGQQLRAARNEAKLTQEQLAVSYMSCPPAARDTLLKSTQSLANELSELVDRMEAK